MEKKIRRILFKIIATIVLVIGIVLLTIFIPQFSSLDGLYNDSYNDCSKREEEESHKIGHYENRSIGKMSYDEFVSDYQKKDCVEEASKAKNDKESSLRFWVVIGIVTIILGIVILFVSFI